MDKKLKSKTEAAIRDLNIALIRNLNIALISLSEANEILELDEIIRSLEKKIEELKENFRND